MGIVTSSQLVVSCLIVAVSLAWPVIRARRGRVGLLAAVAPLVLYAPLAVGALLVRRQLPGLFPDPAMWLLALCFFGYAIFLPLGYLVLLGVLRRRRPRLALIGVALCALALGLGGWAWLGEPSLRLVEQRYEIVSARAPRQPLSILHVSDLQTDGPGWREERVLRAIARGRPDLVVFSGDFMNDDHPSKHRRVATAANAFARALSAPLGAYAVLGDWDGWGDDWPAQLRAVLRGSALRVLRNERVALRAGKSGEPVTLFGIAGGPLGHPRRPDIGKRSGLRIVIAHNPDVAAELLRAGEADLILAGHTHGGQIVLPGLGALITHTRLGHAGGIHHVHGIPLVISRGIGMRGNSAPRIRFNCPPEISWITVRRP